MKIACSSESFAKAIAAGSLTQLEWLDACANELEVDGVVFAVDQFPRRDAEYLAQLKKSATDLGLTVAAVADDRALGARSGEAFDLARALGAPLVVARAPAARDDAGAWNDFVAAAKDASRAAKAADVTLAIRNGPHTLCAGAAELRRLGKDVDGSWLRYALDLAYVGGGESSDDVLAKTVIVAHEVADLASFASDGDAEAAALIARLARFRAFVVLESSQAATNPGAYAAALSRFTRRRAETLEPRQTSATRSSSDPGR